MAGLLVWVNATNEARYSDLCVNELSLRLNRQMPVFDLGHEREVCNEPHFIYCTIDNPATGEKHARALRFRDHAVTDLKVIRL